MRKSRLGAKSNLPILNEVSDFYSVKSRDAKPRHAEMPELVSIDSENNLFSPLKGDGLHVSRFGLRGFKNREKEERDKSGISEEASHIVSVGKKFRELDYEPSEDFGGEASPIIRRFRQEVLPPLNSGRLIPLALQSPKNQKNKVPLLNFRLAPSNISHPWNASSRSNDHIPESRPQHQERTFHISIDKKPHKLSGKDRFEGSEKYPLLQPLVKVLLKDEYLVKSKILRRTASKEGDIGSSSASRLYKPKPLEIKISSPRNSIREYDRRIRKMREELDDMNRQCAD